MTDQKVFSLALFGFSAHERRVLSSMLKLAAARGRIYQVADEAERATANMAIVDGDQPRAVQDWKACRTDDGPLPSVLVSARPQPEADGGVHVPRPYSVRRLLEALDQLTIRRLRYVPELTINDAADAGSLNEAVMSQAREAASQARRSGARALVVDDSPPVRKLMEIELGLFGVDVDFAATGEEALEQLRDHPVDIVFLDVMLPGIDGYSVCKALRRQRPTRDIPVVMLTGRGSRIDRIRGAMAGCSMYLTKPVAQEELHDVIQRYLSVETPNARQ